jgi:hypothetical protein
MAWAPKACVAARVQVCAPSNSALDEIVLRLVSAGLTDQEGRSFTPNVVRVGVNIHHSVLSVALDTLVDTRLGGDAGTQVTPPLPPSLGDALVWCLLHIAKHLPSK